MKRLEDSGRKPAPWAVNLVVHPSNPRYAGDLELVEKYRVPVVLTSKGAPGDAIKRIHGWGAVALHDIANRRHAEKALEAGVDGVIAVAGGAGGHTGTINPFALMNEVRQLGDHSTLLAPYNTFIYLTSAVPNTPMLRVEDFPELAVLREHWTVIRDEAVALMTSGAITKPTTNNDLAFASFYKRDWRRFYLKWYGDYLPSAQRLCPRTVDLLDRAPSVHAAMFAVLAPQSRLVRHRDPFAGSVRYHLGLVTPNSERCRILVDGVPYVWRDGEDVVFDETYVHRAENRTDTARVILFCDVERPLR